MRIPEPVQHAILALLRSGDLERHVRKMRLEYARRRAALVEGLNRGTQGRPAPFRILGDTAGIHVVLELPGDYPAARLVEAAAERGVRIYPLDRYYAGKPTMNGLILGYGTATLPADPPRRDRARPPPHPPPVSPASAHAWQRSPGAPMPMGTRCLAASYYTRRAAVAAFTGGTR